MIQSKSRRELRGGATQSKLRFESRLGAEWWNQVVIGQNVYTITASRRHQAFKRAQIPAVSSRRPIFATVLPKLLQQGLAN
ncbi:hypothetical protein [Paenibacillus sp. PL91]|uniref:hypothetical protein n=1 Tax=Paenibacillus sp. PL91 TaxID=2729538 RepID=UPI00145D4439|nr:hypothetical protein [Paenibacillus sp. PL91]MBC9203607.1 hypothetical protein [Paenibacillus sp. PL91]